jgi:hypothetical protein
VRDTVELEKPWKSEQNLYRSKPFPIGRIFGWLTLSRDLRADDDKKQQELEIPLQSMKPADSNRIGSVMADMI